MIKPWSKHLALGIVLLGLLAPSPGYGWDLFHSSTAKKNEAEPTPQEVSDKEKKGKGSENNKPKKVEYTPITIDNQKLSPESQAELKKLYESLHEEDRSIFNDLRDDEELAIKDIGMLWQAAVERSSTIRYAIEKLSRRDATGKPVTNDSLSKRVLQSVTRLGGVAGSLWSGSPAGLLGSNMIEEIMHGDPLDPSLLRVSDADMLLLAKEVEALQSQVIETYYIYKHAQEQWGLAKEANLTLEKHLKKTEQQVDSNVGTNQALQTITDSLYQSIQQDEATAKQAYFNARNALGLIVGEDAMLALDKAQQEKSANTP